MRWNWQQSEWPDFSYDPVGLQGMESQFLKGSGVVVGAMQHIPGDQRQGLTIELIAQETVDSSAIEGEILDRASVQSSLARHLGLQADRRRVSEAEAGAAELMASLYRSYAEPLSDRVLFDWHAMLMTGRRDLGIIGGYRTHPESMQIVSGALYAPRVHYEAPPSDRVPVEMQTFLTWFNDTAPDGPKPLPAIARAGIAHIWFETIHPFEDGNGRIGRAIAEKALAQTIAAPTLTALAETINCHRSDYYMQLQRASQSNRIDDWLMWFAKIVLEAQARTLTRIRFLIDKTRLLDRLRGTINARQEKVLIRMFAEGPDGFKGGLSAQNYRTIADTTTATTTRDLAELVNFGALRREGERKSTRYYLILGER